MVMSNGSRRIARFVLLDAVVGVLGEALEALSLTASDRRELPYEAGVPAGRSTRSFVPRTGSSYRIQYGGGGNQSLTIRVWAAELQ